MFTGIIEEVNTVQAITPLGNGYSLVVHGTIALQDIALGDSIAVNGVCLTVVSYDQSTFTVEAVEETIRKSSLGQLRYGSELNIERALRAGGKLGGHYVQGHVDCTAVVRSIETRQESWIYWFEYPEQFSANIIPQGSIAIDGVSLTISERKEGQFAVSIIPHTRSNTLFHNYSEGTVVNIEFDMIGKYVINFLRGQEDTNLNTEKLRELGY